MIKKPIEEMTRDELATYARHLLSMIANLQAANRKKNVNVEATRGLKNEHE